MLTNLPNPVSSLQNESINPPDAIHVRQLDRLAASLLAQWERGNASPFHQMDFLEVMEQAKVEEAEMIYLYFYRVKEGMETCVATAALSIFTISLDLFVEDGWWVHWLKNIYPRFFRLKILFCGTPVSIGHKNLHINSEEDEREVLELLDSEMQKIAAVKQVKHLVIKELKPQLAKRYAEHLQAHGWFEGHSIPCVDMEIEWPSYQAYIAALRSKYRRQVLASIHKIHSPIANSPLEDRIFQKIQLCSVNEIDWDDFFQKYMAVMERAPVKLEVLNRTFFYAFFETFSDSIVIFRFGENLDTYSYFLTFSDEQDLWFLWTARQDSNHSQDDYFNLYQAMIAHAIRQGYQRLRLGQTAYYTKMRLGGIPEERMLLYKAVRPWINKLLSKSRHLLFPPTNLQPLQVFHAQ